MGFSNLLKRPKTGSDGKFVRPVLSTPHKWFILFLFCFAEFMDAFIASALFPGINDMIRDLKLGPTDATWIFASYSATFAGFLLISGRVADVYSAKWCFLVGSALVGIFSLGAGFCHTKVPLFVLRALTGIGAAMTVPSALSLIVEWFPDPQEQNRGIAFFGGSGALGNVLGIIIGGIFVQWANWRCIYYFTAMMGISIAILALLAVPSLPRDNKSSWRRLDLGGVALITASVILFIFAVTSGAATGWGQAKVIAPLIISILLAAAFFVFEAYIDPHMAALPPRVWSYPNVPILVAIGLVPFLWWFSLFFQLMPLFQNEYHWSPIMTSVRFLPTGVFSALIAGVSSKLINYVNPKWTILAGLLVTLCVSITLPFADSRIRYWEILFPAFCIGTMGNMVVYTNANIAIFMNTPPEIAGTVGAMYNAALQLGSGLGIAVLSSITSTRNAKEIKAGRPPGYKGLSEAYWFIVVVFAVEAIALLIFYKIYNPPSRDEEKGLPASNTLSEVSTIVGLEGKEKE